MTTQMSMLSIMEEPEQQEPEQVHPTEEPKNQESDNTEETQSQETGNGTTSNPPEEPPRSNGAEHHHPAEEPEDSGPAPETGDQRNGESEDLEPERPAGETQHVSMQDFKGRSAGREDAARAVKFLVPLLHRGPVSLDLDSTKTPGGWINQPFLEALGTSLKEQGLDGNLFLQTKSEQTKKLIRYVNHLRGTQLGSAARAKNVSAEESAGD